jgi:tetratricopeptide (TPR) repeat protein
VESAVKDIFSRFGGTFRLVEAPDPGEAVLPPLSVLALIYEGSACLSPDQLRGIAFRLDGVVLPRSASKRVPAELALGDAEKELLAAIDGKRSIGSVLRTAPGADLAGVRLLYALHCTEQSASGLPLGEEISVTPAESLRRPSGEVERQAPAPRLGLADTARLLAAEGRFHRAKALIGRNDFKAAHAELLEATRLDGDEGDYRAYLGWTHFRLSPRDPAAVERALGELEKALELNPQNGKAYLFRGYVRQATGDLAQARSDFERALQSSGNSPEALDALLRMNARVA